MCLDCIGQLAKRGLSRHSLAPDDPNSAYYLALDLLHDNDPRVEPLWKRAIVLDTGLPDAHYQLVVHYARQGNPQAAAVEGCSPPIAED